MKKIMLTLFIVAGFSAATYAQKGSVLVYGTISYFNSKHEPSQNKNSSFALMPGIGYQFNNNWTVGLTGGIGIAKVEGVGFENKQTQVSVGPFIRYTKTLSNTFFFYSQLEAQYQSVKVGTNSKYTGFLVGVTPALGVNVYKGLALNFSIGSLSYATQKQKGTGDKTTNFGLSFGNQFNVGVSKNF